MTIVLEQGDGTDELDYRDLDDDNDQVPTEQETTDGTDSDGFQIV